jgi:hypothetical protein
MAAHRSIRTLRLASARRLPGENGCYLVRKRLPEDPIPTTPGAGPREWLSRSTKPPRDAQHAIRCEPGLVYKILYIATTALLPRRGLMPRP